MNATQSPAFLEGLLTTPGGNVSWLSELRRTARRTFDKDGLPGRRTEAWKYTRLNRLLDTTFLPADKAPAAVNFVDDISIPGALRVVLADGHFALDMSDLDELPDGVTIASVAALLERDPARLEPWLGRGLGLDRMPMAAVNTVGFVDGVFIEVSAGTNLDRPIHVMYSSNGSERPVCASPRLIVAVGDGASADVVESNAGTGRYLVNSVSEIYVGAGSRLGHFKLQDEGADGFHVAATAATVTDGGFYDSFVLQTGASLARNEIRTLLEGENARCHLHGAYVATGDQHLDNTTFIDHAAPHTDSREVYKGVLSDSARGVFQGKILVRRGAQKTD